MKTTMKTTMKSAMQSLLLLTTVGVAMPVILPTVATAATSNSVSAQPSQLARDLMAFNETVSAAAQQSQAMQDSFMQAHKGDTSLDVQVQFMKAGISSLEQQKTALQAVNLTDPRVKAVRDKFVKTIDLQKSAYTMIANNPKPTKAQADAVEKQMQTVEKTGMDAQKDFMRLAQEAGLKPVKTAQ